MHFQPVLLYSMPQRSHPSELRTYNLSKFSPAFGAYRDSVGALRTQDVGDASEFLKLNLEQIKQHYGKKMHWTSTPTFRIRSPAPKASAKK